MSKEPTPLRIPLSPNPVTGERSIFEPARQESISIIKGFQGSESSASKEKGKKGFFGKMKRKKPDDSESKQSDDEEEDLSASRATVRPEMIASRSDFRIEELDPRSSTTSIPFTSQPSAVSISQFPLPVVEKSGQPWITRTTTGSRPISPTHPQVPSSEEPSGGPGKGEPPTQRPGGGPGRGYPGGGAGPPGGPGFGYPEETPGGGGPPGGPGGPGFGRSLGSQTPKNLIEGPKPQTPDPFTGEREKWITFLIQASIYFAHYEDYFQGEDRRKAMYFLSWFQGRIVRPWADSILTTVAIGNINPLLDNFEELVEKATELWGPINEKQTAQKKLERITQKTSISAYHSEFTAIAIKSEYNEPALNRFFYKGLKESIKNLFVNIQRPQTVAGTLAAALEFETRILEQAEDRQQSDPKTVVSRSETSKHLRREVGKVGKLSEEERRKRTQEGRCFNCGLIGHLSRACPRKTAQSKIGQTQTVPDEQENVKKRATKPRKESKKKDDSSAKIKSSWIEEDFLEA